MSTAARKALSDAAKARWAAKKTVSDANGGYPVSVIPPPQPAPLPPSPAVLQLQEQVVALVSQRQQARTMLNESHNAYLLAQSRFQAAESELKGIEAEVQYRIGLIAQLENRQAPAPSYNPPPTMPGSMTGVSSEPSHTPAQPNRPQEQFAVGLADDFKRNIRGMM